MQNPHDPMAMHRRSFREKLLPLTIDHARANVPAYRNLYGGIATPKRVEDLQQLPLVEKGMMKKAPFEFRDRNLVTKLVQHTSGTTADPLVIHRSDREVAFINDFQKTVIEERGLDGDEPKPVLIAATGNFHGQPTPLTYAGPVFPLNPRDSDWDVRRLISDPASVTGTDSQTAVLMGLESELRIITCQLLETGYDFTSSKVQALLSTGSIVTRRRRNWYEKTWGVDLFDHYSMTEMLGGARHCEACGFRHLEPTVIGEAVDPVTKAPVDTGYGVLLITNLYPFVQQQPFIRYWTGDLIRLGAPCGTDSFSFELEGRLRTCTLERTDDGIEPLISGAIVYNILDDFPDVNSSRMFTETKGISDHSALGNLKFNVETSTHDGRQVIDILIETRYAPYEYPDRASKFCEEIRRRVIKQHPILERREQEGRVKLRCFAVPRGRVKSFLPDWVE